MGLYPCNMVCSVAHRCTLYLCTGRGRGGGGGGGEGSIRVLSPLYVRNNEGGCVHTAVLSRFRLPPVWDIITIGAQFHHSWIKAALKMTSSFLCTGKGAHKL
jgi:hypothetical protein